MTLDDRRVAVAILLGLTLGLRFLAHVRVRSWAHRDGVQREGVVQAILVRLVVLVVGLGGAVAFVVRPGLMPFPLGLPGGVHVAAVVVAMFGLGLLFWVQRSLSRYFSGTLHLEGDHELVQSGPYRWVRHPMYTSFLLLLGGLAVLIGDALVGGVLLLSQVWVLFVRLPVEERMLADRFGAEWEAHRARTGLLGPRLAVRRGGSAE